MAPQKTKGSRKEKDKNIKNTSAAMDAFMALATCTGYS